MQVDTKCTLFQAATSSRGGGRSSKHAGDKGKGKQRKTQEQDAPDHIAVLASIAKLSRTKLEELVFESLTKVNSVDEILCMVPASAAKRVAGAVGADETSVKLGMFSRVPNAIVSTQSCVTLRINSCTSDRCSQ